MNTLQIGMSLPAEIASQTTAILGIRGSGKTVTASVIAEELLKAGRQVIIIDPTDVWWGLRCSPNGEPNGFPILVIGGERGDLPLDEDSGALLARFVVEERASVVLSLRHLRKAAQRRFVTAFAEELYALKGKPEYRSPCTLVIDECDAFIPQRVGGAEAAMVGAFEDIVRRGRAAGLGVILISQRAASVNKDVLTQLETLIAHRHTSPQDRKALHEWVQAHDTEDRHETFFGALASLKTGVTWVWSPLLDIFKQVKIRERRTFDSSKTPTGSDKPRAQAKMRPVDVDHWKNSLGKLIERKKEEDPRAIKSEIQKLRAENEKLTKRLSDMAGKVQQPAPTQQKEVVVHSDSRQVQKAISILQGLLPTASSKYTKKMAAAISSGGNNLPASAEVTSSGKCARAILAFLGANYTRAWSKVQIGIMVGYSPKSSSFLNAISALASAQKVKRLPGGTISITDIGFASISNDDQGMVFSAQNIRSVLGKCEAEIFDVLVKKYDRLLTKNEIAQATVSRYSETSSSFNNALSKLCSLGVAIRSGGGIAASGELIQLLEAGK